MTKPALRWVRRCKIAALPKAATKPNLLINAKPCMFDEDFEPYKI